MLILICGGSGSGKSEFAEQYAVQLAAGCEKYYIATMTAGDDESLLRIKRHRERRGDDFITLERGRDVGALLDEIKEGSVCLLECLGNLVANEMFGHGGVMTDAKTVADKVCAEVEALDQRAGHLIVVSNDIFSDVPVTMGDTSYDNKSSDHENHKDHDDHDDHDDSTYEYVKTMGMINRRLAKSADEVIESVCGKTIYHKGKMFKEKMDETQKENECNFILVTGGACQGQLEFVRRQFKTEEYAVYDGWIPLPTDGKAGLSNGESDAGKEWGYGVIFNHLEKYVISHMDDEEGLYDDIIAAALKHPGCIIIGDEVGCGIVPVDEKLRCFREVYGRLMVRLARRASQVWRVYCGIGERID